MQPHSIIFIKSAPKKNSRFEIISRLMRLIDKVLPEMQSDIISVHLSQELISYFL